jgi:phytanoyl-CoA hydroxylase
MPELTSREQREAFQRDGFVNAGRLLEPAEVEELREELDRHVGATFYGRDTGVAAAALHMNLSVTREDDVFQLTALWMNSEIYRRLIHHPKIAQVGAELAGSARLQLWSDQVLYKPPRRGGPIGWHQDAPYFQAISPPLALTAWVSLDDADVEAGCLWMVPGSHRWGVLEGYLWQYRESQLELADFRNMPRPPNLPPELEGVEWPGARPCPTRAGEVHFHHCLTWHGSPANRSNGFRRGYAIHYMPEGVVFNGTYDPRVEAAGITEVGTPMLQGDPLVFPLVYPTS